MKRPSLERQGRPVQVTAEEAKLLDDLWAVGQKISKLEEELIPARKLRDSLVREARARRFYIREIAELGSLSPAGVCFIVKED